MRLVPSTDNKIKEAYVDKELGNTAVTYILESGEEDSIHLDAFLDYNKDPEYMAKVMLYKLTLTALELGKFPVYPKEKSRANSTPPRLSYIDF